MFPGDPSVCPFRGKSGKDADLAKRGIHVTGGAAIRGFIRNGSNGRARAEECFDRRKAARAATSVAALA